MYLKNSSTLSVGDSIEIIYENKIYIGEIDYVNNNDSVVATIIDRMNMNRVIEGNTKWKKMTPYECSVYFDDRHKIKRISSKYITSLSKTINNIYIKEKKKCIKEQR